MQIHCIQQSSWRLHYSQTLGLFPYTAKSLNWMHKHLSSFSDLFLALSIVLRKAFKYPKIKGSNKVPKSGICNKKYTEWLMPMISYRKYQGETYNRNPNSQTWIHTEITKKLKTALCGLGLWVQKRVMNGHLVYSPITSQNYTWPRFMQFVSERPPMMKIQHSPQAIYSSVSLASLRKEKNSLT